MYLTLVFDQPLCILGKELVGLKGKHPLFETKRRQATFIVVMDDRGMPIKDDWIGHHVDAAATVLVQVELNALVHRLTDAPAE